VCVRALWRKNTVLKARWQPKTLAPPPPRKYRDSGPGHWWQVRVISELHTAEEGFHAERVLFLLCPSHGRLEPVSAGELILMPMTRNFHFLVERQVWGSILTCSILNRGSV
jgi:hypothetical protein